MIPVSQLIERTSSSSRRRTWPRRRCLRCSCAGRRPRSSSPGTGAAGLAVRARAALCSPSPAPRRLQASGSDASVLAHLPPPLCGSRPCSLHRPPPTPRARPVFPAGRGPDFWDTRESSPKEHSCHCAYFAFRICAQSLPSYPTLCDPMDCSPPGSSGRGVLLAGTLEWVAVSFSGGSAPPGIEPVSAASPAWQLDS